LKLNYELVNFVKILIVLVLLIIFGSLVSAMLQLLRKSGDSRRMAKALTLRIGLSLFLFILLFVAFALGWITPHGVVPPTG